MTNTSKLVGVSSLVMTLAGVGTLRTSPSAADT
jgi:hypothetical protein